MAKNATRKARATVDPNETKSARFQRLAGARTNKIIKQVRAIARLRGGNYESTPEQINKMFKAIQDETKAAYERLSAPQSAAVQADAFKF